MEERLQHILGLVTENLKFAETKNATLFAANAATIFGSLQILTAINNAGWVSSYFIAVVLFSTISALTILISFLPQTTIPWLSRGRQVRSKDSLLFFGDVERYDARSYLSALYDSCEVANPHPPRIELMYAEQIIINSRIASRKYTYFRYAIGITLAGILTPIVAIPILRWLHTAQYR